MMSRENVSLVGVEGALMVISPLLFLLYTGELFLYATWQLSLIFVAAFSCTACAFTLPKNPIIGKSFGVISSTSLYASVWPHIINDPSIALAATVLLVSATSYLYNFRINSIRGKKNDRFIYMQRAWWGNVIILLVVVVCLVSQAKGSGFLSYILATSMLTALMLHLHWAFEQRSKMVAIVSIAGFAVIGVSYLVGGLSALLLISPAILLALLHQNYPFESKDHWWELLLNHPARALLVTFFGLCVAGAFLLSLPVSTHGGLMNFVDASFTSVSAVCVTGLIVQDTPSYFTAFGEFCILLLIQLGGLGIMSITTVALYAMGRRLSLRQERLLATIIDTDHKDLVHSLKIILKFTLALEGTGAVILFLLFHLKGDSIYTAAWRGVFTAISAFCNAGFALQSDSLISFQKDALVLHTIAALIVAGGIAPATSLLIPRWISGKPIPLPSRVALSVNAILLAIGALFMMIFEWNGVLSGLSIGDKIHNAWFQSVTLRTAGFNSVDIACVTSPTFLVMIAFMFIGGSPGGTAGGVKTTTIGVLAMTFWANITNQNDVVAQNRLIHSFTIYRAITIVASGVIVWFLMTLMLQVTQQISARDIIFETTSALGTVGLSTGATFQLDEIGKIIIMITMFAGRIGPMTIFMTLNKEPSRSASRCPVEKMTLT